MGIYVRPNGTSAEVLTGLGIITTNRNVLAAVQRGARPTPAQQVQQQVQQQRQPAPAARAQLEVSSPALREVMCQEALHRVQRAQPIPVPVLTFAVSAAESARQARDIADSFTPAQLVGMTRGEVTQAVQAKIADDLSAAGYSVGSYHLGRSDKRRELRRGIYFQNKQEYDQIRLTRKIDILLKYMDHLSLAERCAALASLPATQKELMRTRERAYDRSWLRGCDGRSLTPETTIFSAGVTAQLAPFVRQVWPVLSDFVTLAYEMDYMSSGHSARCNPAVLLAARVQFDRIFANAHNAYRQTYDNVPFVARIEDLTGPQYPQLRDFYTTVLNETLARQARLVAAVEQANAAAAGLGLLAPRNLTARPMVRPTGNQIAPQLAAQRARAAAEAQRQTQEEQARRRMYDECRRRGDYICAEAELG